MRKFVDRVFCTRLKFAQRATRQKLKKSETEMADILITNARIFDGTGADPYTGEVLIDGNRISQVRRGVTHPWLDQSAHGHRPFVGISAHMRCQ